MGRKGQCENVVQTYARYLRQVMPMVASSTRYPKLVQYEYQVAKLVEKERNKELIEKYGEEVSDKLYKYGPRDVHPQVGRAMKLLVETKEVKKIGRCYYPISEEGLILYEILMKNIKLSSPKVHIVSGTAFAIAVEAGQNVKDMKSALQSCLGDEYLFGVFAQDDLLLILLSPDAPKALLAEFISWVSDAYAAQHSGKHRT